MLKLHSGRTARPASAAWNVAKTLFQVLFFWGFFLFVLPAVVFWLEGQLGLAGWRFDGPAYRVMGIAIFALGGCVGLTSGAVMAVLGEGTPVPTDCPRKMVVAGPYRFVRNPMAVAGLAQGVAVGLWLGSPAVVLYSLAGGPVWNYLVRPWEELDLEQRFGEPYRRYCRQVRCWWPRFPGYRGDESATCKGPTAD